MRLLPLTSIFFNEDPIPALSAEEYRYTSTDDQLVIRFRQDVNDGNVYYNHNEPTYISKEYGAPIADIEIVSEFTKDLTLGVGEFELTDDVTSIENGFSQYEFNERFEDALMYCNEVVVKLEEEGITEAKYIRYEPVYFTEESYEIYPPDEALYRFMSYVIEEELEGGVQIKDIGIGYRLSPDGMLNQRSIEIEPYYRIKIGSGQKYYINAYTNELIVN